jgi:hypothetical protein
MVASTATWEHEFFPTALGEKAGEWRVWAYQSAGESDPGWRCFSVAKLSNVRTRSAPWIDLGTYRAPRDAMGRPPSRIDAATAGAARRCLPHLHND